MVNRLRGRTVSFEEERNCLRIVATVGCQEKRKMTTQVVSEVPVVFQEEAATLNHNSDAESLTHGDGRLTDLAFIVANGTGHAGHDSLTSLPPEITVKQASPEVCIRPKKTRDADQTSGYGSDALRESIASSDIPEETLAQSFNQVLEIASQTLRVGSPSHSQSSSSSMKQSQDSLSLSSHDSDDLLRNNVSVGTSSESEDDNSEEETSQLQSPTASDKDANTELSRDGSKPPALEAEEIADRLMVWAKTELVPVCHAVLDECEADLPVVLALQSSLRQLSNAVSALCAELLKKQSGSFGRFSSPDLQKSTEMAMMKPQSQLSFVVRVLSPTVNSLIPIISSLSRGFNEEVYQGVVFMLQKLAWKVEACVCYENPSWNFECHKLVFDESRRPAIARFLNASPLEPPPAQLRVNSTKQRYSMVVDGQATEPGSPSSPYRKGAAKRVASVDPQACLPSSPGHHRASVDASVFFRLSGAGSKPSDPSEVAINGKEQQMGIEEEEEEKEDEKEEGGNVEDDDFFRPLDMRRCQTIDLTPEELKRLGIKKSINFQSSEESVKEFQAFRSYSLSFFRRPQHSLSRVPRFFKSIRRSRSIIYRGANSPTAETHSQRRESVSSNLEVPPSLAKVPSFESLSLQSQESNQPLAEDDVMDPFPSPTQLGFTEEERANNEVPKSTSNNTFTLPARFKRWSAHDKRVLSVSETVKLPRERSSPKTLFSVFGRRHSQHFSETNLSQAAEGQQETGDPSPLQDGFAETQQSPLLKDNSKDEYMQLSVEVRKGKKDSAHAGEEKCVWFLVTVKTNISQYPKEHSEVCCTLTEVQTLMSKLQDRLPKVVEMQKPGKKATSKKLKRRLETFLHMISNDKTLRTNPDVIEFLQPNGGGYPSSTEPGQEEWGLLATFYCPDHPLDAPDYTHGVLPYDGVQTLPGNRGSTPSGSLRKTQRRSISLRMRQTFTSTNDEGELQTKIIREDGKDVLMYQVDGCERKVMAGTFDRLVRQLAGEEKPDSHYVTIFLYGMRHFAKPVDVATKLIRRFAMEVPPDATEADKSYAAKWREIIQQRILDVLFQWMQKCWADFVRNEEVLKMLLDFLPPLMEHENINFQIQTGTMLRMAENVQSKLSTSPKESEDHVNVAKINGLAESQDDGPSSFSVVLPVATPSSPVATDRSPEAMPPSPVATASSPVAIASSPVATASSPIATDTFSVETPMSPVATPAMLLATPPEGELDPPDRVWRQLMGKSSVSLAKQLTVIDLQYLKAIDHFELALHIWEKKSDENKPFRRNLDAYIARFNEVSFWVGTVVCSIPQARDRGTMVEKFIEVAKHCYDLKNFNTMTAILSGLSYSAVKRLKGSWVYVREKAYTQFMRLEKVMDPANNSSNYRTVLARVSRKEPCIPFFGVYLKDFVFLNDGHPTRLSNGLINFTKLRTICMKIEELSRYQYSRYSCPKDKHLHRLCFDLHSLSEAELYEKSLEVEPKEASSLQRCNSRGTVE